MTAPVCRHENALPVDSITDERVAWLCPDCDRQLPARFDPAKRLPVIIPLSPDYITR